MAGPVASTPNEALVEGRPGHGNGIDRAVIAWVILVFALLFLGLAPLYILHLDLAKLNANSSGAPPIALVGIVFTAYTPTIAALLIAWHWPRAGGVRKLLKQVTRWRVHVGWYLVALLGPIPLLLLGDLIYVMLGGAAPHKWLANAFRYSPSLSITEIVS